MIARHDTRREAIAALKRQRDVYRTDGEAKQLIKRLQGHWADEVDAIYRRIEVIRGLG
jgi:hypothetical protein